jgi:N-acetylglucosamine-6-phosphate deacetylase
VSRSSVWASRAITPDTILDRVRVEIEDGRITAVRAGEEPGPEDTVYEDATLVPGLVDLQVNGGGGGAYGVRDPGESGRATAYHVRAGTTSLLATLVTAPLEDLASSLRYLHGLVSPEGPVVGLHLEGPFLSPEKVGAHERSGLRDPDPTALDNLLTAGSDVLRMVTLAPERPGALDSVERIATAGIVVSAGHSVATLAEIRAAVERGLSFMTHVGNASDWPSRPTDPERGFRMSEPGMVGAFLIETRLRGSVILDGLHLHPELAAALIRLRGVDNVALVSDATHAAGLPAGDYRRGGLTTRVHPEGYATTDGGLAGSTVPLIESVRTAVREARTSLQDAVRMATRTPAEVIGIDARKGSLRAGADADLLVLDGDLAVRAVHRMGSRVGEEGVAIA